MDILGCDESMVVCRYVKLVVCVMDMYVHRIGNNNKIC